MGKINHSSRAHAILSASGSARWINCTPSARLEDEYGVKGDTAYTKEGTVAHELAEFLLRSELGQISDDREYEAGLEQIMANELYNDEMLDMVPLYTNYCREQAVSAGEKGYIEIEKRLNLSEYIPDSFGTADCVVVSDDTIEVIDLKYGKGVPVSAEWNTQLMIYGLGALQQTDLFCEPTNMRLTIVQPRLDNISSFDISVADLLKWADEVLKPAAKKAFAGEGELSPGAWCKFCAVKARCRALYEEQLAIAKDDFKSPHLLTDEEVAKVLEQLPTFEAWVKSVKDYASEQAINNGKHWPGFKVVEGRSNRQWSDPENIGDMLLDAFPELSEDQIYRKSVETITTVEKLVGKKRFASIDGLTVKPAGAPTLVPESDKRPAIGIEQAKLDFSE